jgi:LPS-assembly lipoprotein
MNILKVFFTIIICLSLSACGFKIRTADSLPKELHTLYLKTEFPYTPFNIALKQTIKSMHVTITDNSDTAPYTLNILAATVTHTDNTIYTSAQASVYSFTFSTTFQVTTRKNVTILPAKTISVTRNLTLNPNEILQASNQVDSLLANMYQEVIFKILAVLSSKQVQATLISTAAST